MDYLDIDYGNPLMKVAWILAADLPDRELSKELLERLDLHLQSGYQPTLDELDFIAHPGFYYKNIQPFLETLLKSSASPISYSSGRGRDSACFRSPYHLFFFDKVEKMISWANQEGDSAPSPQEIVQTMVKVGHGIDEMLVGAVWNEMPQVIELLLQEGADPDFRIDKELAEILGFLPDERLGEFVGSTALHLLFQMGQGEDEDEVKEEVLFRVISIMLEAGADVNAVNSRGNTPLQEFDVYLSNHEGEGGIWELSPGGIKSIKALLCASDQRVRKRKSRN